jgi:adenosine deaminase
VHTLGLYGCLAPMAKKLYTHVVVTGFLDDIDRAHSPITATVQHHHDLIVITVLVYFGSRESLSQHEIC